MFQQYNPHLESQLIEAIRDNSELRARGALLRMEIARLRQMADERNRKIPGPMQVGALYALRRRLRNARDNVPTASGPPTANRLGEYIDAINAALSALDR